MAAHRLAENTSAIDSMAAHRLATGEPTGLADPRLVAACVARHRCGDGLLQNLDADRDRACGGHSGGTAQQKSQSAKDKWGESAANQSTARESDGDPPVDR